MLLVKISKCICRLGMDVVARIRDKAMYPECILNIGDEKLEEISRYRVGQIPTLQLAKLFALLEILG